MAQLGGGKSVVTLRNGSSGNITFDVVPGSFQGSVDNFDASVTGNPNLTNYHILVEVQ